MVLKTPPIPIAFKDAGLDSRYQPAINTLAKASADFYSVLPAYLEARRNSGVSSGKFSIPADIRGKLLACADVIDAAINILATPAPSHKVPTKTISQFRGASSQIRQLADGSIDGYGYDYEEVKQSIAFGFINALVWTQNHHQ